MNKAEELAKTQPVKRLKVSQGYMSKSATKN